MKVLVLGQGGREHALVRALRLSPSVSAIHAIPGSEGMSGEALCHTEDLLQFSKLSHFVKKTEIDLAIVGPEAYLAQGLSDFLRAERVLVVGPSQSASQLETSKVFAKAFMTRAGVSTASYVVVDSVESTLEESKKFSSPYVLKADGLASGKGVFICDSVQELKEAAQSLFEKKLFGLAGERAVLEEFCPGTEMSFLVLTNGDKCECLPVAQDHKRLRDNDKGPNTGGMGAVAPILVSQELKETILSRIVEPTLRQIQREGFLYRGVLYFGLMITKEGPRLLEYNVRFGDPECQVILPLLDGDWGKVFQSLAAGDVPSLKWKNLAACCVVMAAPGYPEAPQKDVEIEGLWEDQSISSYFLHCGTKRNLKGGWVTNGGRVINSIGLGGTVDEARKRAYTHASQVNWTGMIIRSDIGLKG